jgi:hypothetical protein
MIILYREIDVQILEVGETGLNLDDHYPVIGTYHRIYEDKDGKKQEQDLFMVLRDDGKIINLFPSKCKIRRYSR